MVFTKVISPRDPQQQVLLQAPEPPEAPVPEAAQASSQQVGVLKSRFFSENEGKTMEKPWKNHENEGKTMEKPWKNHENDGKTMEKQWKKQ